MPALAAPCATGARQRGPALAALVWRYHRLHFQPGVRYRLRVVEVRDPNPPADASGLKWVLDAVVEQEPVRR